MRGGGESRSVPVKEVTPTPSRPLRAFVLPLHNAVLANRFLLGYCGTTTMSATLLGVPSNTFWRHESDAWNETSMAPSWRVANPRISGRPLAWTRHLRTIRNGRQE